MTVYAAGIMTSFGDSRIQVNIFGGLGNQFFCYFAGKFLSLESGLGLTVNVARVKKSQFKLGSSLEDFRISELVDRTTEFASLGLTHQVAKRIARATNQISNFPKTFEGEFLAKGTGFEPNLRHIRKPVVLNSYFQTYRYIDALPLSNQGMPNINGDRSAAYNILLEKVKFHAPVIIHYRRGDYLNHSETLGNLSKNYYEGALSKLPSHLLAKGCWVFSDDLQRARHLLRNIDSKQFSYIRCPESGDPAESLVLMSKARALVTANSTFSLWSALLSSPNTPIVVPEVFHRGSGHKIANLPSTWNAIPSIWADRASLGLSNE
jgi:hypothetical protein